MRKWYSHTHSFQLNTCCAFFLAQSKALNKTGKPIFFNACEWGVEDPWEWMAAFANSWRSGPDHHDDWKSTASIIEVNADKGKYAGDTHFIMFVCLLVGITVCLSGNQVLEVGMTLTSS